MESGDNGSIDGGARVALARRCIAALSAFDLETLTEVLSADAVWHVPGASALAGDHAGRGVILRHLIDVEQLTGGSYHVEVVSLQSELHCVLAECRIRRQQPSGPIELTELMILIEADGRITEIWSVVADQNAYDRFWATQRALAS